MKYLSKLMNFNIEKFLSGKDIRIVGDSDWVDYIGGKPSAPKGTIYKCVVVQDKTLYDDETRGGNDGESINIKILGPKKEYKKLQKIKLTDPVGKVYGDYRNQLSVTASQIDFE